MAANGPRTVAAVLVAAGDGQRLGAGTPKAFCPVAGRTLLEHAVVPFREHPQVRDLVVVAPAALLHSATSLVPDAVVVPGGRTRQLSVLAGLAALADDVDAVLVHDVARPFVPAAVIARVVQALRGGAAAVVPVTAVTDTIRRVDPHSRALLETLDRGALVAVQTPQGFSRAVLAAAHAAAPDDKATDDAALAEAVGATVVSVPGAAEAFKITHPWDLVLAEAVATR